MHIDITARIGFPSAPPVEGHYASIAKLHDLGFLYRDGDYLRSLERAGFVIVERQESRHLEVAPIARGVFSQGVRDDAETLLEALASEGFEGVIHSSQSARSWYLSGGRLVGVVEDGRLCA
jgi:hypothetical protein